jgi:hypothetical protein
MSYLGDQDSVVSIVTCYGLEGPGIDSQWGWDFLQLSRPALGPTQPPTQWVLDLFPGAVDNGIKRQIPQMSIWEWTAVVQFVTVFKFV